MTDFIISNSFFSRDLVIERLQALRDEKEGTFWISEELEIHKFSLIGRIIWIVSKIFPCMRKLLGAPSSEILVKNLTNLRSQILGAKDSELAKLFNEAIANCRSLAKKKDLGIGQIVTPPLSKFEEIKVKTGNQVFDQVYSDLEAIDALIGGYEGASGEKKKEFFGKLAKAIYKGPKGECYVRAAKEDESMPLASYLKKACNGLLSPGSFIRDEFIAIYLHVLEQSFFNPDLAILPDWTFRIEQNKPIVNMPGLEGLAGSSFKQILMPVNICGMHWVLYLFSLNDGKISLLSRLDSFEQFSSAYNKEIFELELTIVKTIKEHLQLDPGHKVLVQKKRVTQQAYFSNDCGVHVCKNAEWIAQGAGKCNPHGLKAEEFSRFRLEILLSSL